MIMHSSSLVVNAFQLVVGLSLPLLLAILAGALLSGVFRVVTQIDDPAISFVGRLAGLAVFLFLAAGSATGDILSFGASLWGTVSYYQ